MVATTWQRGGAAMAPPPPALPPPQCAFALSNSALAAEQPGELLRASAKPSAGAQEAVRGSPKLGWLALFSSSKAPLLALRAATLAVPKEPGKLARGAAGRGAEWPFW